MCEPTTIVMAVGAVVGAYSKIQQGKGEKQFADYQAKQEDADAKAEMGAAQVEAQRIRDQGKRARSAARAGLAASGVDVDSGSAIKIDQQVANDAEYDAQLTLLGGADRQARGNASAINTRNKGSEARTAGYVGAFTDLASAGSSMAGGWKTASKKKA